MELTQQILKRSPLSFFVGFLLLSPLAAVLRLKSLLIYLRPYCHTQLMDCLNCPLDNLLSSAKYLNSPIVLSQLKNQCCVVDVPQCSWRLLCSVAHVTVLPGRQSSFVQFS